jgi:hypothetical protein
MDKHAITQSEELGDRVRIHFHFDKPDGIPHYNGTREILYADISNLPEEPNLPKDISPALQCTEYWRETISVIRISKKIAYHFTEWQENARCREQDFQGGPYLCRKSDESSGS